MMNVTKNSSHSRPPNQVFRQEHENTLNSSADRIVLNQIFYTVVTDKDRESDISPFLEIILSTVGIILNVFVLVIILNSPSLRTFKTTVLILSLTISDLFVSSVVMVFSVVHHINHRLFGKDAQSRAACSLWAGLSIAACTASSLNVCAISLDRYILITRPLHYDVYVTQCRVSTAVSVVWTISFFTAFPTFYEGFLANSKSQSALQNNQGIGHQNETAALTANDTLANFISLCEELPSGPYIITVVVLIIIVPCVVIVVVYLLIFNLVIKQIRMLKKQEANAKRLKVSAVQKVRSGFSLLALQHNILLVARDSLRSENVIIQTKGSQDKPQKSESSPAVLKFVMNGRFRPVTASSSTSTAVSLTQQCPSRNEIHYHQNENKVYLIAEDCNRESFDVFTEQAKQFQEVASNDKRKRIPPKWFDNLSVNSLSKKTVKRSLLAPIVDGIARGMSITNKQELKAALILLIIAGTYVVCWLPFGIISIVQTVRTDLISWDLRETLLWLAYSNSCWNPLIYALLNKIFRYSVYAFFAKHGCLNPIRYIPPSSRTSLQLSQASSQPTTIFKKQRALSETEI